jgi:site-specific DNA recombinase
MLRGVTYNRYSSENQRSESIDAQKRYNHDYARRNGIEIVKDYVDEAKTGKSDDRENFQQMLSDAKQGLFDVVICHKVDRFARNRIESAINKYNLRKCHVKVVFSGQSIDDSPEGQLMEGILESFAEYYSSNLAKETMKGLRENALKCKFNGGSILYGYSVEPVSKNYLINENEAHYVRYLFKRYAEGAKYDAILNEIKALGMRSRDGRIFTKASLHDMLKNEKYAGIYTFNKRTPRGIDGKRNGNALKGEDEIIRVPGGMPAIIDMDLFIQVQEKMNLKKRTTRAKEIYLLSGLIICGVCSSPYCGNRKHNGSGNIYTTYRCNGRKCGNKDIYKDVIESMVYQKLTENIFSKEALKDLAAKLNDYLKDKRQDDSKRLEFLKSKITEINFQQTNILNAIAQGYDQPMFKQKLNDLDEEMKAIRYEYELTKIKMEASAITPKMIDEKLSQQRQHVLDKNLIETRQFIASYVDSVMIFPDEIEINLKFDSMPV